MSAVKREPAVRQEAFEAIRTHPTSPEKIPRDARRHPGRRGPDGILRKVGVTLRRPDVAVPEQLRDGRQALAERQRPCYIQH